MPYSLGSGIWSGVFAVPNAVVDMHLKMASGLAVKALLLLLRVGGELEVDEIADRLGYSPEDIRDALKYWESCGVLAKPGEERENEALETAAPSAVESAPVSRKLPEDDAPRRVETISASRRRLTTQEINLMAEQDENIEYLLQETQSALGKPLTPLSTEIVTALYTYYSMKPDMILMLVHYCASIGKDSMRYIERVAADWMDRGVDTHEKAEAEILRLTRRDSVEGKIKSAFGIYDRGLVSSEKKYIKIWTEEYKMELPVISFAYERAVELKGKLSFPYINGILTNWHEKGISNPAQAAKEIRDNKSKQAVKIGAGGSSYDIGELESMIANEDIM